MPRHPVLPFRPARHPSIAISSKSFPSNVFPAVLLTACLLALPGSPRAGCGLSFCPKPEQPGERNLDLGLMTRQTAFDIQGTEGGYTELMATIQYTAWGRLALGLHAPFILLDAASDEAGVGNFIAYAEWRLRPAFLSALAGGVQAEIPMGGSEHGLGDDHWMAVPYLTAAYHPAGRLMLGGALGTSFSVYGDHEEGHHHSGQEPSPIYVHPHEHFEFLYRLSAGARLLEGAFLPEAFLDGQHVLGDTEEEGADTEFLSLGVTLPWGWNSLIIAPNLSIPVLSRDRYSWSAGISLGWKLGLGGGTASKVGET